MGERRGVYRALGRKLREREHLGDPDVEGMIRVRWISGSGMGDMDWIDLGQDRDGWRGLVNAVMNLLV